MKILHTTWLVLVSLTLAAQDEKADMLAIKKTIERETTSFFNVDQNNWQTNWLDVPYAYWAYADSTGGSSVEGTENIRKNFDEYFKTAKPSKAKIDREWLDIRVYGKGAYARFVQKATDGIDVDVTSETRVLEKDKEGKWRIICLIANAKYPAR